jgi:hypothetical protein
MMGDRREEVAVVEVGITVIRDNPAGRADGRLRVRSGCVRGMVVGPRATGAVMG